MPNQEEKGATASARGITKEVRDGSSASRAVLPGDSKPGWDMSSDGTHVVHSEVKAYQ